MSNHQHDLNCLEVAGNLLYCKVTGEAGVSAPKKETQKPTPPGTTGSVLQFPGTRTQTPAAHHAPAPVAPAPVAPANKPKRSFFTVMSPDEGTRSGGSLAYPYSLRTYEEAKAKAIELLARKTRTPYLTVVSHIPNEPTTRAKITRADLGPEPSTFYVVYGREYDLAKAPPVAKANTLSEIKTLAQRHLKENPEKNSVYIYAVTPGRGSPIGRHATTVYRKNGNGGFEEIPKDLSRNNAIRLIKEGLKKRSGKEWSVTGGSGTAYGWIKISAPPKRLREGSYLTEADAAELGQLLGLERPAHHQGESIPSSSAYYVEYIDRAAGRSPRKRGVQYWD